MQYNKTVSGTLWQILDIVHEQTSNGSGESTPDIPLARLVPFKEMEEKWDTFSFNELVETGLNCVHEATHSLYIKHVYNGAMAYTFLGNDLVGEDITILVEERVDNAANRVRKLTATYKATLGQSIRGGDTSGIRGEGRRGGSNNNYSGGMQQQYDKHSEYDNDSRPVSQPSYVRFNGNNNFGGSNGGGRGNGVGTCFICDSIGHQAKQCPKVG